MRSSLIPMALFMVAISMATVQPSAEPPQPQVTGQPCYVVVDHDCQDCLGEISYLLQNKKKWGA